MNRRSLFKMLSAVPLIGGLFAAPAVAVPAAPVLPPFSAWLSGVRDLLLTSLRMVVDPDIEADIQIDFVNDCLLVKGYCFSKKKLLGFAITRESVETGRYKDEFRPNVLALVECLKGDGAFKGVGSAIPLVRGKMPHEYALSMPHDGDTT